MIGGQIESLLEKGIEAARQKEKKRARDILINVIEIDQNNEKAWLWLSSVVETEADKRICLENALYLNPDNTYAAMGLNHLRRQPSAIDTSVLPRLASERVSTKKKLGKAPKRVTPPPKVRVCPRCQFHNPGWAYLCDSCGANLRHIDLRDVVREASEPREGAPVTLLEAWGSAFIFDGAFAFRPEIELASWGRSIAAWIMATILASLLRILPAVIPVLANQADYDVRGAFATNAPLWGLQTLWLALALALLWAIATLATWLVASLLGGEAGLKIHAHLVMVAATAWLLLSALTAAIVILIPYLLAQTALDLPFQRVFNLIGIMIGFIGFIWLIQATREAHALSNTRAIVTSLLVAALGAILFFGLDFITNGLFTDSVAWPLLVFFLPWLGGV